MCGDQAQLPSTSVQKFSKISWSLTKCDLPLAQDLTPASEEVAENIARLPAEMAEGAVKQKVNADADTRGETHEQTADPPGGEEMLGAGNENAALAEGDMADDASKPPKSPVAELETEIELGINASGINRREVVELTEEEK